MHLWKKEKKKKEQRKKGKKSTVSDHSEKLKKKKTAATTAAMLPPNLKVLNVPRTIKPPTTSYGVSSRFRRKVEKSAVASGWRQTKRATVEVST